jgi:hypothetical protein
MRVNNKLMIQSYIVTAARYDFDVYEKRIIYRLVEICQQVLEGQKLNAGFRINNLLYEGMKEVEMPISAFLKDEKDNNYTRAKEALFSLNEKVMQYEDDEIWKPMRIIELPEVIKTGHVKFVLHKQIHEALLNFSKGFRKFELKTAMSFESVYAMRFYELLSGKKEAIIYSIDNLKTMFQIENKYKESKDFIRRVIEPAREELAQKAPFSFTFTRIKQGKKVVSLQFFPYEIPENMDQDVERKRLERGLSLRWSLDKIYVDYLKQNYLFENDEIRNNLDTFKAAVDKMDLLNFLAQKRKDANSKAKPKGWIIGAIKRELKKLEQPNNQ